MSHQNKKTESDKSKDILLLIEKIEDNNNKKWLEHQLTHDNLNVLMQEINNKHESFLRDKHNYSNYIKEVSQLKTGFNTLDKKFSKLEANQSSQNTKLEFIYDYVLAEQKGKDAQIQKEAAENKRSKRNFWIALISILVTIAGSIATSLIIGGGMLKDAKNELNNFNETRFKVIEQKLLGKEPVKIDTTKVKK
jgi:hypothetical protein